MNIAFKIWISYNQLCFFHNGFMAAHLNNSSLMKRQRTKTASAIASTVTC